MVKILRVLSFWATIVLLVSCNPNQAWQRRNIEKRETAIMDEAKRGIVDTPGIKALVVAYDAYVKAYPLDTNSANYLFKEADFYRFMQRPERSVEIYAGIYTNYPQYFKRPYALFLQGFIYENEIHNLDSARVKYVAFLNVYPNHPISKDVKTTLDNLGKSPEQMMKEFEEKQHADSLARANQK